MKIYFTRILIFDDYNIINLLIKETWIVLLFILIFALARNTKKEKYIYFSINFLFSIALLTMITYYDYYGNVITYKAMLQFNQIGGVKLSVIDLLKPISFLVFLDLFIVYFVRNKEKRMLHLNKIMVLSLMLLAFTSSLLINNHHDNNTILNNNIKAEKMGIFNYQLYTYIDDQFITVSAGQIDSKYDIFQNNLEDDERKMFGVARDKNIMFIQLEAVQNFPINLKIDNQEITPNLNKLINESIYFSNFYQQVGVGTTSDAEFIVNTSIHPVGDIAMSHQTKNAEVPSLPRILEENSYDTATFHTNEVTFWDRNYLYDALDFNHYYDKEYFGDDNYIAFGSSDEVLYEKTIPELVRLSDSGQKYYANVIAMSSHHPYDLSEEYHKISLPEEYQGTKFGNYLTAVNYADYALGLFFEDLKENNLYEDTMFVIYGDHYALPIEDEKDEELYRETVGNPYSEYVDKYNIPLIIHMPWLDESSTIDLVGGQVDIMPTVMNLAGINPSHYQLYGRDLLNSNDNLIPIRYYVPDGSFINSDVFFVPGETYEDGYAINLDTREINRDVEEYRDDYEKGLLILQSSDQYVKSISKKEDRDIKLDNLINIFNKDN